MTTPYIISTPQPPVGTVYPFIGGGTTIGGTNPGDPNGWVLCDGQPRTAPTGDKNRYTALAPLLNAYLGVIGNTGPSITPPDFRSKFLYGQSSTDITAATGGSGYLIESDIPTFNVTLTEDQHRHTIDNRKGNTLSSITSIGPAANNNIESYNVEPAFSNLTLSYVNTSQTALPDPPKASVTYVIKY